jgi:uncharacterized membrane protein
MNIKSTRIQSIDVLRGVVMVIMALDHTRDYFHMGSSLFGPTDLQSTTPFLFFTRFITHYCAPVFIFLAGTSAFLYGSKKKKQELFKFLFTRGLWLILLEIILNNLLWRFDLGYNVIALQVIWAIGLSMVLLSFIIFLNDKLILAIGIILVGFHNLLDNITMDGYSFESILWYILHQRVSVPFDSDFTIRFAYPIIPWLGLMILGYYFGRLYLKSFNVERRKKWLIGLGIGAILLFILLRSINLYGNLTPWSYQKNSIFTFLSFINVTKYPPSLDFILITIGPSLLFLYAIESVKNKITDFFLVFGRVPLFYYFLHVLVLHVLAVLFVLLFTSSWEDLESLSPFAMAEYGYPLYLVYVIWIVVIVLLYFPSKKYMTFKATNKDKWWLSYL